MNANKEKRKQPANEMLIDASHPEETRVAVVRNGVLEDLMYGSNNQQHTKGNIYMARITRVEASLQAAFVDYGGRSSGFLPFSNVNPALCKSAGEPEPETFECLPEDDTVPAEGARRPGRRIQHEMETGQMFPVMILKEQRGNKAPAFTTYLSLAGKYSVLMTNNHRSTGGISRKLSGADRSRLKQLIDGLDLPEGMELIGRTAAADCTAEEFRADCDYLMKLWGEISAAIKVAGRPRLLHDSGGTIRQAVRDMSRGIDRIYVAGDAALEETRQHVQEMMPGRSKLVKQYKGRTPIFAKNSVEKQIGTLNDPMVKLPSGGGIVIQQTEALVAIDVNSSRSTGESSGEKTAVKTNLEACAEIARQLRLRDLGGIIVVDFISMRYDSNNRAVEKAFKQALAADRARIKVGELSFLGLMEMSRQRMFSGITRHSMVKCPTCKGSGSIKSVESVAVAVLRAVESSMANQGRGDLVVKAETDVLFHILNKKRDEVAEMETRFGTSVQWEAERVEHADYLVERVTEAKVERRRR